MELLSWQRCWLVKSITLIGSIRVETCCILSPLRTWLWKNGSQSLIRRIICAMTDEVWGLTPVSSGKLIGHQINYDFNIFKALENHLNQQWLAGCAVRPWMISWWHFNIYSSSLLEGLRGYLCKLTSQLSHRGRRKCGLKKTVPLRTHDISAVISLLNLFVFFNSGILTSVRHEKLMIISVLLLLLLCVCAYLICPKFQKVTMMHQKAFCRLFALADRMCLLHLEEATCSLSCNSNFNIFTDRRC